MGSSPSLPALGTWAAPTRRVKISLTARTVPFARSGRESRAVTAGIEDDGIVRLGHASQADSLQKRRHESMKEYNEKLNLGKGSAFVKSRPEGCRESRGSITPYLTRTLFPTWKRGGPDLFLVWLMVHSSVEL